MARISRKQFLQALINQDVDVSAADIAKELNISKRYFYNLRVKYQDEIIQTARQIAVNYAIQAIKDLVKQSQQGKTVATSLLLEIAKVKEQETSLLNAPGSWRIQIEKIAPEHQIQTVECKEIEEK